MSARTSQDLFDDFRPGPFETLDRPALISHVFFLTLGALFLWLVWKTPPRPIENMTIDQLPKRVSRLLLNQSDLAKLSTPERAAVPPSGIAPKSVDQPAEPAPEEHVSKQAPPPDASGVPTRSPGGGGGGGGTGAGSHGAAVASGVAQQMAATGALAEVDRIVGDFTGVVASDRGGRALRQGGAGSGIEHRSGTPGAKARSGADLGGVDEILGKADQGGMGGRGTAGAGGGGGGGGVGRAQVRIAAPAPVSGGGDAAAEGRTAGALMAVVQRHAAAVRFCYNRLLAKRAGASGQIVIRLTVAADGSVSDANVVRSTLNDPEVDACVLGQAREWRFPPSTEAHFIFDVPFVFTPPTGG